MSIKALKKVFLMISWLLVNPSKTKLIHFQTSRTIHLRPLSDSISSSIIEVVPSVKLLGLVIDNNLSWEQHLQQTTKRIRKRIYMLHAIKQANPSRSLLWLIYCTMLRSIASYAYPAWCNISKSRFSQLVTFERRLCRISICSPRSASRSFANLRLSAWLRKPKTKNTLYTSDLWTTRHNATALD